MTRDTFDPDLVLCPSVHLNGSGFDLLWNANRTAFDKVQDALDALRAASPHGRDFYVQGVGAFDAAARQHIARVRTLKTVEQELAVIVATLSERRPSR